MLTDVIELEEATVSFDGFVVLNHLDFALGDGELRFLIGPNGAGKTTLMDVISGKVRLDSGRVRFRNRKVVLNALTDLNRQQRHQIVRLGIGRKFQTPSVYRSLTCFENLEVSMGFRSSIFRLLRRPPAEARERLMATLEEVGLAHRSQTLAGALSHGEQQWLEIAMLLVQEPRVLLLDEPVAGMTRRERERTGELIHSLEGRHSILITEHDMDFVRQFSRKVTVLHQGSVLAEGTVDVIQSDPAVMEVYLGRSAARAS
ncbi:MAG: urea ABC transporter ATP-binding protein UrtD [Dehalococcoidia bacterium]